jgi:ribosome-associated toxin RatA of RatAB toxin-antitoxin module
VVSIDVSDLASFVSFLQSTVSRSNLFEYLDCLWEFKNGPSPNRTALNFRVDFQFRSPLYHRVCAVSVGREKVVRLLQSCSVKVSDKSLLAYIVIPGPVMPSFGLA